MGATAATTIGLARWIALSAPLALLGGAYISQYGFGLNPCEMCVWQRLGHFAALALAAAAVVSPRSRIFIWLAAAAITASGAIGGFHAGVEYGWWEGIGACTASPAASGGDALEAILDAPLVRCDVAPWSLWGVSLAGWNFLFSTASVVAIGVLLAREDRERA